MRLSGPYPDHYFSENLAALEFSPEPLDLWSGTMTAIPQRLVDMQAYKTLSIRMLKVTLHTSALRPGIKENSYACNV
jgi:hypothetical protein